MPRQGRIHLPGGIYHVVARGIERAKIFKDKHDREEILRRLAKNLKKTECRCYAWALMSNHFHLLIRAGQYPLSDLMRKLMTGYSVYFKPVHPQDLEKILEKWVSPGVPPNPV